MKTKLMIIGLMLFVIVTGSVVMAAPGQRGPRGGGFGYGPGGEFQGRGERGGPGAGGDMTGALLGRLGEKLELTDEQKTAIKAVLEEAKANRGPTQKAVQDAMKALHEATDDGSEAEIIAAGKAVGDAFTNQSLQRASVKNQIDAVLTDEQKAELAELKTQMKERRQQRMQQREGQGPGQGRGQGRRGGRGFGPGGQGGEGFDGGQGQRRGRGQF